MVQKLFRKLWMMSNRKPHSKQVSYLAILIGWIYSTVIFCMGVMLIIGNEIVAGIVAISLALLMGIYCYAFDNKTGYIDAIHDRYLHRRKEKIEKYEQTP